MRLLIHFLILILLVSCFPTAPDNSDSKLKFNPSDSNSTNNAADITVIQKFIKVNPLFSSFNHIVSENSSFVTSVNIVDVTGATLTSASGTMQIGVFSDAQCSIPVTDGYVGSPISTVTNGVATFPGFGLTKPISSVYVIRFMKFTYNSGLSLCTDALRVYAMLLSYSNSVVSIEDNTGTYVNTTSGYKNDSRQVKVTLKNTLGAQLSSGGYVVTLAQSGGTSSISLSTVVDNNDGTYSATLTGQTKGTQRNITASVSGSPLTSSSAKYTVNNSAPVISSISDQTVQQYMSGTPISFTVSDIDGDTVNCNSLSSHTSTASSVFTALSGNISGSAPNCVYSLKNIGTSGSATIKMKYTDGTTASSERSFTINSVSPAILMLQEAPVFRGVMVNFPMTKTFTLVNVGGTRATNLTLLESTTDPFVFSDVDCTTLPSLNPGATCTFQVTYTPTAVQIDKSSFSLSYFDGVGTRRFAQTFGGSGEQIRFSQSQLDFSGTRIGGTAEKILMVHNPTEHQIILDIQFSGASTGDGEYLFYPSFPGKIHNNTTLLNGCVLGAILPSKGSCQVAITYKPMTTNIFSASLLIKNTNTTNSPIQTLSLTGYGYLDPLTGLDASLATCSCDPSDFQACGDGSIGNPFLICSSTNLIQIADSFATLGDKHFKLVDDIDLSTYNRPPLGNGVTSFSGTFNGNNFSLKGFAPSFTSSFQGLFSKTSGAYIYNLNIPNFSAIFTSTTNGGVLIGYAQNTVLENIQVQGLLDSSDGTNIGGLVGSAQDLAITFSSISIQTNGINSNSLGTLVGYVDGLQVDGTSIYSFINLPSSNYVGGFFGTGVSSNNITKSGIKIEAHEINNYASGIGNISDGDITGSDLQVFGNFFNSAIPKSASFFAQLQSTSSATNSIISSSYASSEFVNSITGGLFGDINLTSSGSKLTISDVQVNTKVNGQDISGGVISKLTDGGLIISNLTNVFKFVENNPTSTSVGGLIGYSSSSDTISLTGITSLVDQADSVGPSGAIAGKLDSSNMTLTTASIYGLVNSGGNAGGVSGEWRSPKLKLIKNYSNVVCSNNCAGFVGVGSNASITSSSIQESLQLGNIYGEYAGGLVGNVFTTNALSTYVMINNYVGGTISGYYVSAGLVGVLGTNSLPKSEKNVVALDTFVSSSSSIYPFGTSTHTDFDYFWLSGTVNSIEKPVWYPTAQVKEKFLTGTQMGVQGNFSNLSFPAIWNMGGYYNFPYKQ